MNPYPMFSDDWWEWGWDGEIAYVDQHRELYVETPETLAALREVWGE